MENKTNEKQRFALCLNNKNYEASLEVGKLYRIVPDEKAATRGYIRIIDESGEDYMYESDRFFPLHLPQEVEESLLLA